MKKRLFFLLAAVSAVFFLFAGCTKKPTLQLSDGIFSGTGAGRNGPIQVVITVSEGIITDARITKQDETPDIANPAEQSILKQFLKAGGVTSKIDAVSGATITSSGVLDALNSAVDASLGIIKSKTSYNDIETDIVIIGAGGAGLAAATQAASLGAKVIVLEKNGFVGGNTSSSTGGINASETKVQKHLNIFDTNEQFFKDTMVGGHYKNDEELVHTLVESSSAVIDWLQSDLIGADLSDVGIMAGSTNKRTHRPLGGQAVGSHLVPKLYAAAKNAGAEIRLGNGVIDIIAENGIPAGVKVHNQTGAYIIKAKAIIIATGGFGANASLIGKYRPDLQNYPTTNVKTAQGDAFTWVEKFDGALVSMEEIQIHPSVVKGQGILITEAVRGNGAIMINHQGKRFINELDVRDVTSKAILSLPEKSAYIFFNQTVRESLKAVEDYVRAGLLIQGDTIEEIAGKLEMDPDNLENTIAIYNQFQMFGQDKEFGRLNMAVSLSKGPYYAVEIEPAIHHTMGGIKINSKAQVLNKKGEVIPHLYAAGEVTGGIHGDNRLGGNAVADICVFGKIAAESAVEQISK